MSNRVVLVDVYTTTAGMQRKATPEAIDVLYRLLQERDASINISHKSMPTIAQHKSFIASEPYLEWFILRHDTEGGYEYVGAIYITRSNEIGLFIFKGQQGKGYGSYALDTIKARYPKMRLLANIAPSNVKSQEFFYKHGFKIVQHTYELTRS